MIISSLNPKAKKQLCSTRKCQNTANPNTISFRGAGYLKPELAGSISSLVRAYGDILNSLSKKTDEGIAHIEKEFGSFEYGRSMTFHDCGQNKTSISVRVPEGKTGRNLIKIVVKKGKNYPDDKMVIITTGSQGEPMSALTKMAFGEHRKVSLTPNDYVIISATPIPGNEKMVSNVVNELMKRGVDVIYERMYDVHVSGHACQEELKLMMGLVKPKYFLPVHGEQKHLQRHASLGVAMGIDKKNIYIGNIGDRIELSEDGIKFLNNVTAGAVYVDGIGVGDVGSIVLNDRKHLSKDGIIIVVATIDSSSGRVVSGPDIVSRGFVYVKENEALMNSARDLACRVIDECYDSKYHDWNSVKTKLRDEISRMMYDKTKRSPMILPILMEI